MTTLRSHVVSVAAILFALAVGVVLGTGPLRGADDTVTQTQAHQRSQSALQAQVSSLTAQARLSDDFARTVAPRLVAGTLRGQAVTVVALPHAQAREVRALTRLIGTAGGSVTGVVRVGDKLVDVADKQLVAALGSQLRATARGVRFARGAGPYGQLGSLLARAVGSTRRGGEPLDPAATSLLAGLDAAKLVSVRPTPSRRGNLVLFVAGEGSGDQSARRSTGSIVTSLVQAVDAGTGGVVLAGPASAAQRDGLIGAVRSDTAAARVVSTVDSLDGAAGQAVAVLALAGQAAGDAGHYGSVAAADGALPGAGRGSAGD